MIIYNTTYCVKQNLYDDFIDWLKQTLIPTTQKSDLFVALPTIAQVLTEDDTDENAISISVQLTAENLEFLQIWFDNYQDNLDLQIKKLFGEKILSFSTFMKIIN